MEARRTIRKRRRETGIALLIAIFILLLIGVVAIALIVSSGTETALAGNYRSSTSVYYAAVAGLEEARARLRSNNPNSFNKTAPGFLPPSGTPLAACAPVYIINPIGGESIAPWDSANKYFDQQFSQEFGVACGGGGGLPPNPSPSKLSDWNRSPLNGLPFPGPLYKWVRINGVSEQSLNLDTYPHNGIDSNLIYYDGAQQRLNDQGTGSQVLEITALAVLPNGSQKLLQYIVAPSPLNLNFAGGGSTSFPAALTLIGNNVSFTGPNSTQFQVNGNDQCGASSAVYGIGYTNGIVSNPNQGSYSGAGNQSPNIVNLNPNVVPPNLQTPSGLDALVQTITQNADVVLTGPTNETHLPGMSAGNPVTVVVNGDFDLGSHSTGFGVLVVTGTFSYDTDSSWKGVILVIGQGTVVSNNIGNFNGEIDGAILAAKTRDPSGNLLPDPNLGSASFKTNDLSNGGLGIYYNSCWIQKTQPTSGYKILSFHEIAQ